MIQTLAPVKRRMGFNGWTRGLVVSDRFILVGESAKRRDPRFGTAAVAVICRKTWKMLARIPLPCREIYGIVMAPRSPAAGGCKPDLEPTRMRTIEQDQHALFRAAGVKPIRLWATGEALPPRACRVRITAPPLDSMAAGSEVVIDCGIQNLGGAFLVSAQPNPVYVSYRWLDSKTRVQIRMPEGNRTTFPRPLPPGESLGIAVSIKAPPLPGSYLLRLTLVQEFVTWFDTIDPRNARDVFVHVEAAKTFAETTGRRFLDAPTQSQQELESVSFVESV